MFLGFEPTIDTGLIEYTDGDRITVKGVCKNSVYVSDENEFAIFRFIDDNDNCFKIKGNIKEMKIGNSYNIEGTVKSFNGEKQLSVYTFLECKPFSKIAIIAYLQTLPGLHSKAELIFDEFGMDSIDILENDPMQLTKIKGIGTKSVEKWAEEIKKTVSKKHVILELLGYGLTQKQCVDLLKEYDSHILTLIRNNPYFLVHEVRGFGFLTCDKIAANMGFTFDNANRIINAAEYILENASNSGHVYLPLDTVVVESKKVLDLYLTKEELSKILHNKVETITKFNKDYEIDLNNVSYCLYQDDVYCLEEISEQTIKDTIVQNLWKNLVLENDNLYIKRLYYAERDFAEKIVHMCKNKVQVFNREEVELILDMICKKDNIELEAQQREAVITFNMYDVGIFILNGSAGTGKTFVAKLILKVNEALNYAFKRKNRITLLPMAPTGKATKVMQKSLNRECITIHRGLQWTENGFMKNKNNTFEENTIFVDETSMLDIELANKLLDAIDINTKVIFIGDTKQLPSVGPGKVLSDLIESHIPIVITLNIVKRQGQYSGIIRNANRIILGEMIITEPETKDFFVIEENNYLNIQDIICKKTYSYTKEYDISDIQVLTPQRPGALGVNMLNYLLQRTLNPLVPDEIHMKKGTFELNDKKYDILLHFGDKVINTKNDYSLVWHTKQFGQYIPTNRMGITNGECGIIDTIRKNENGKLEAVVKFDDYYILYEDVSNLDLAYALTIHKSQGSQWPIVIMPIVNQHSYILSNNLLYTGVTRTTTVTTIVGQTYAIKNAINTFKEETRNTTLQERLIEEWNKYEE